MKYVQQKRLEEGKQLLLTGRYTVSEVSVEVGYTSVQAFSRGFKSMFSKSPLNFMKLYVKE